MKLTLVSISRKKSAMSFPLGVSLLKALLDQDFPGEELKTEIIHSYLHGEEDEETREKLLERIMNTRPDLVGFSTYIWNREAVTALSIGLRKRFTEIILLAGGAEATANPNSLFADTSLDFIVRGDGEMVLPDLIRMLMSGNVSGIPTGTIRGLLSRKEETESKRDPAGTSPVYNPKPGLSPSPFLKEIQNTDHFPGVLWETARGCPYGCSFCYESKGRKKIATYPVSRLEEELKYFTDRGVSRVMVLDPSFNTNKKHAMKILKLIEKFAPSTHFTFEIKGEELDEELAEAFSFIDCYLQTGLQSSNPTALKNVSRIFDEEKFSRGCGLLHREGIPFGLDLIYGLPGDTFSGFLASLDYALSLRPENLDIFPLAVLPGTQLGEEADRFGLEYSRKSPYLIKASPEFPAEDIVRAADLTAAADSFLSGGTAYWFMPVIQAGGISPSEFLLQYSAWTGKHPELPVSEHREIFTEEMFRDRKSDKARPAAVSLIRLYEGIGQVIAGEEEIEVILYYTPDELENIDMVDLSEFPSYFHQEERRWIIRIIEGELDFQLL